MPPIQQGMNQQTPAVINSLRRMFGTSARSGAKRRKSSGKKRSAATSRKASSGGKLKFGSPAWQKKYKVGSYAVNRGAKRKK